MTLWYQNYHTFRTHRASRLIICISQLGWVEFCCCLGRHLQQNGIWWNGTHQVSVVLLQLYFLGEWKLSCSFHDRAYTVWQRCCTLHWIAHKFYLHFSYLWFVRGFISRKAVCTLIFRWLNSMYHFCPVTNREFVFFWVDIERAVNLAFCSSARFDQALSTNNLSLI